MRTKFSNSIQTAYIYGALAVTLSSCVGVTYGEDSMSVATNQHDQAFQSVATYVRSEKGWPEDSYRIEFKSQTIDILVFWIIHHDDESVATTGGGKSFELQLDARNYELLRVLHFQ